MSNKNVCILLADGFEEVEALTPADILRRLNINVVLTGLENHKIRGSHDFYISTEILLKDISSSDFDAIILPGGLPGAINLRNSEDVIRLLNQANASNKICAAICASPIVLRDSGIAQNKRITGYPGTEQLSYNPDFKYTGSDVEIDGTIITAKGMGKSFAFSYAIAQALGISEQEIKEVFAGSFIKI